MPKKHHREDEEEKNEEKERAESSKISTVEIVFFTLLCLGADIFEILASLAAVVPVLGWVAWGFAALVGALVSAIVIIWGFMRGIHGQGAAKKIASTGTINLLGEVFDVGTLAFLPVRTLAFLISVAVNNYLIPAAEKAGGLGKLAKSAIGHA